jgi:spore coat assembly protein
MSELKIGDIVARKSYGCDIFFKVVDITQIGTERVITLKGISYRIKADAPESDLEVQPENRVREYRDICCRKAQQHNQDGRLAQQYTHYSAPYYRGLRKKNNILEILQRKIPKKSRDREKYSI